MKRVWGISFFFFGVGLLAGLCIDRSLTQIIIGFGCVVAAYCLFFH
ncbi:MAG: hypothetical protein ACLTBR_09465 [Anaerostipes sp.]